MGRRSSPRCSFAARSAPSPRPRRPTGPGRSSGSVWKTRVTVRAAGSEAEIAEFTNNTWKAGGTLQLADGRSFRASTNFWMTSFEFQTESEHPLVRFRKMGGVLHLSCKVGIEPAAARLAELPWLVALGWYLAVKMHDDAAGAAAAAAAG